MRTCARDTALLLAGGFTACVLASVAPPASAFTIDARRLGMGGAFTPRSRELATANVAYHAVADRPSDFGRVIPLPLGLVQLATDFPTFDAESESFDVLRITETILHPPFFLELTEPDPMDGDISISLARNAFAIDFDDARDLLPQEPIRAGTTFAPPLFGLGIRGAQTFVAPLLEAEARVALDDPLYAVLSQGAPLLPNSRYDFQANATSLAGTSFHAGWSGGGWGAPESDGVHVGAFAKYVMGFGFGTADTRVGLATADTIFGDEDPLDVLFDATTRYAPFGQIGNGIGFDAGVAYRAGALDVGVGVRDIATNVWFGKTTVEHSFIDDATGEIVSETVATDESFRLRLPMQTTVNLSWSGRATVLAADLTTSRWGTTTHFGAERRIGWLALRGGLLTDERHNLQYAGGLGLGLSQVWLDVGLQSHGYAFTEERGWTLGTSIGLR